MASGQRWAWRCALRGVERAASSLVLTHFAAEVAAPLRGPWSRRSPRAQEVGPAGLLLTPPSQQKEKWHYCFPRASQFGGPGEHPGEHPGKHPGEHQAARRLSHDVDCQAPPSRRCGSTSAQPAPSVGTVGTVGCKSVT